MTSGSAGVGVASAVGVSVGISGVGVGLLEQAANRLRITKRKASRFCTRDLQKGDAGILPEITRRDASGEASLRGEAHDSGSLI
jgi:hypothetical protein